MTKKLISCFIALTLILGLAVVTVSADTRLSIVASGKTVALGNDVTVEISITAPANSLAYFAFSGSWDKDDLTYKSSELKKITSDTSITVDEDEGTFSYQTVRDANADETFDNTVVLEITFTAKDEIDGTSYDTVLTLTKWEDSEEGYYDNEFNPIASADVATTNATITLVATHTAPDVDVAIDGDAIVGNELKADVTVTDPWELDVEEETYSWVIDGKTVSKTDAYTPVASDLGKEITLTVTATVDAEDEPTGTGTATVKIVGVVAPASVRAGKDIVVSYAFADDVADKATAEYTADPEAEEPEWTPVLAENINVADGKVTVATDKSLVGNYVVVTIEPVSDGEAFVTDPIEVKKASTSGKSLGGGASLVAKSDDDKTDVNNGGEDKEDGKNTYVAPKDAIVLTIGNKTAYVFGEIEESDVAPKIANSRTMLPARLVSEALGAVVAWDGEARTVTITKGDVTIVITIDSDIALVNGEEVKLDSPAFIENDRTYTPMRFIAENLDATVDWEEATQRVIITPNAE